MLTFKKKFREILPFVPLHETPLYNPARKVSSGFGYAFNNTPIKVLVHHDNGPEELKCNQRRIAIRQRATVADRPTPRYENAPCPVGTRSVPARGERSALHLYADIRTDYIRVYERTFLISCDSSSFARENHRHWV